LILLGDFNAKIEKELANQGYQKNIFYVTKQVIMEED
jgi:hypothetical protein